MAKGPKDPRYTEPLIIPCLFVSGTAVELAESFVRIVGWVDIPSAPNEPHERRIITRLVLPIHVAAELANALQSATKPRRRH